uniref:leucine-rich repeat-containing protein 72 n=1 Tax=Podarcis muralis TaxID=64176 RepID=UPI0010A09539|nr:leucine-rich repeat-containing protein 72 [Podarcis muralis]
MLKHNCCLTELYLNNNEIRDISGALKHIHVLRILMLHNNHLKTLEKTVKELQGMQHLQTLNLFNNPMSHDRRYHLYVIYHIPSLTLFDRKGRNCFSPAFLIDMKESLNAFISEQEAMHLWLPLLSSHQFSPDNAIYSYVTEVTSKERVSAVHIYDHERSLVLHSIGFGKKIDEPFLPKQSFCLTPTKVIRLPPGCEFGNHLVKIPYENPEHAVLVRAMRRSVMEFATVDWEKMPTCEEKRLGSNPEKRPERLTIKFR